MIEIEVEITPPSPREVEQARAEAFIAERLHLAPRARLRQQGARGLTAAFKTWCAETGATVPFVAVIRALERHKCRRDGDAWIGVELREGVS